MTDAPAPNPAPTTNAAATTSTQQTAPWYEGKVAPEVVGVWQAKGYELGDPIKVATSLTKAYQEAQSRLGVPAEELIRLPKPNAPEADVKAFLGRLGVPAEAKEYDLSAIKFADGTELDPGFADTMRAALLDARVPKDRAGSVVTSIVKFMDSQETAEKAETTAKLAQEMTALKANWGPRHDLNMQLAKNTLETLGAKVGMTPADTQAAWDALGTVGGIGASKTLAMLLHIATRMGEAPFVTGGGPANDPALLSRESAKVEIDALKKDPQFAKRLLDGGRDERKKWDALHKVAYGQAA
jgi:hypothetical protein